jgi:hypothetical protein
VGPAVVALARRYREKGTFHSGSSNRDLVLSLAQRYRARRWQRIDEIVARLDALPTSGPPPDDLAAEALEHATPRADLLPDRDGATQTRWRAALFDVLVRDALNAGERVADLRLRPGQRALLVPTAQATTLGVTASSSAPWTAQQQRALDDLARARDAVAAGAVPDRRTAPLPNADEWHEFALQLASRRSPRSARTTTPSASRRA